VQYELKKSPLRFSDISEFLFQVHIYTRVQIFIQLPATLMKLRHIKSDHPVHHIYMQDVHHRPNARWQFLVFSPKSRGFLVQLLHADWPFLSTPDYKFLFSYLQL